MVYVYLNPYRRTTTSSQIHQHYPTQVEAAVNRLAPLPLRAPTPTSLWAFISTWTLWLWRAGRFFRELVEKKLEGAERLLKLQTQYGGRILFQDALRPPKMSGQNSGHSGSRPGLGEEPDPGPVDLRAQVLLAQTLSSDFLQSHFRVRR
ncbi:ferritin light chain 1-like [Myotis yumanensis]|uniref:ferritin light chain 1-like n=1 Tax=Myotis yumanensis TaxID=159337 RepID=UPI0038D3ECB8